ncbi:MAG: glycosyltransferase family 39 protein [Lentisphaerae bacterium]|nr:glycosyltransferase family 39 protein [Lentisphaerota bacterium]MCP4103500.1 glycosyltransferase family 39 protein [Lentisphaerota bacterium]
MRLNIPAYKKIMLGCFLIGLGISLAHILFCTDVYNDISMFYGPITQAFADGDWDRAFSGIIGPLNPALASVFVKLGFHSFVALMIVSCIFYVLCIFPIFGFLRILLGNKNYAAWGCVMYILTPKIIRFGCTGLLNSGRNFFLAGAVFLVLSFFEKVRTWKLILLGFCLAGLALNRGEGLLYAPLFIIWLLLIPLQEANWKLSRKISWMAFKRIFIVTTVTLICIQPRMVQMYNETGVPCTDIRQAETAKMALVSTGVFKEDVTQTSSKQTFVAENGRKRSKLLSFRKLHRLVDCFGRGSYWIYLGFALIGLGVMLFRKKFNFRLLLPISVIAYSTLIFFQVILAYRYFTLNAMLMLPFSFTGLYFLYKQAEKRRLKYVFIAALIVMGIFQAGNGMRKVLSRKYDYEKGIGDWLTVHKPELARGAELKMISPKPQYSYWSGIPFVGGNEPTIYVDRDYLLKNKINLAVVDIKNTDMIKAIENSGLYVEVKHPYKKVRVFVIIPLEK